MSLAKYYGGKNNSDVINGRVARKLNVVCKPNWKANKGGICQCVKLLEHIKKRRVNSTLT